MPTSQREREPARERESVKTIPPSNSPDPATASTSDSGPTGESTSPGRDRGVVSKTKKKQPAQPSQRRRTYQEAYIKYGFTYNNQEQQPQCVLCSLLLARESMKPTKMLRHLTTLHPNEADKPVDFFRRKEQALLGEKNVIKTLTTIPAKAQMASYEVAYLIAQTKRLHTIGEILIKPSAIVMSRIMHGDKFARELEAVPLSDNTIGRRITDMAQDVKCQLTDRVKKSKYALQLDESTDIANCAQLLVFVRYRFDGKLEEEMLTCTALEGTCTGEDIFTKLDNGLKEEGLSWDQCIGICADGAGAMQGKSVGLKARVLKVAPHIKFTHCVIHREALASKTLEAELKSVLDTATKIVNFIKSRPLNTRLFATLCNEMGSEHEGLLFHTEVRWLSRGNVLTRLFELRDEVRLFLMDKAPALAEHLTQPDWLARLAYLSCIFDKLNGLNLSLQGDNTNILSLNDKIHAFMKKVKRWTARVEMGRIDMFSELHEFMEENELSVDIVKGSITAHLQALHERFHKYFPTETAPEQYDWIRSPFTVTTTQHLSTDLEDALVELSSDRTLKTAFDSMPLAEFGISVENEYPQLYTAAMDVLIQFASTYLCEKTFSALTYIKNKYRSKLNVEDDLRVAVSKIKPRMDLLCSQHTAHPSH